MFALGMGLLVTGCLQFDFDSKAISGPYELVAVDIIEQSEIAYRLDGQNLTERVFPTVFATGYDRDYIVAARHPMTKDYRLDKSKTEYYYIIRAKDGPAVDPSVAVRGPFNASGFEAETQRLHLPALKDEIASLK